jgi:hypothetical protein
MSNLDAALREAAQLLTGPRNDTYGDPRDTYTRAARAFCAVTGRTDFGLDEAILFMLCVKLAREARQHHRDGPVDMAAYSAILQYARETDEEYDPANAPISAPVPTDPTRPT